MSGNSYLDKFLTLRCAGDVIESVQPLKGDIENQIGEAMAIIDAIRTETLKHPGQYKIVEFYTGNPFPGVIAAHLLPVELVARFDWRNRPHGASLSRVNHFRVRSGIVGSEMDKNSILISARPNRKVAALVANCAKEFNLPMAMVPARVKVRLPRAVGETKSRRVPAYEKWADRLAEICGGGAQSLGLKLYGVNDMIVTKGL